jgi:exodeoxyribonuclease VII large subunit
MSQVAFDFALDDDGGGDTYGVAELSAEIKSMLRRRFEDGVWVRGEIQGWSKAASGHIYFDLIERDDRGTVSTLKVAFFAGVQRGPRERLRRAGLKLGAGLKVRIFGGVDYHAERGHLSLLMTDIDPRFTLGELSIQRQEVVARLLADGRYDANRRVALAPVPLRVGVITSVGSAAWHDFTSELANSGLAFELRVIDVRVQGREAVPMVTAAMRALSAGALDVVVLVRGGGGRGDLAAFDSEEVAAAIAASPLPVLTGLGHETDRSVADEVAHRSLKTPTACATALVERVLSFSAHAEQVWRSITAAAERAVGEAGGEVDAAAHGIRHHTVAAVARGEERIGHRVRRLRLATARVTASGERQLSAAASAVARAPQRLDAEERHLQSLAARVRLLDPVRTMARGWSITRDVDGRTVRDARQLSAGDVVVTTFAEGTATSRVERTGG